MSIIYNFHLEVNGVFVITGCYLLKVYVVMMIFKEISCICALIFFMEKWTKKNKEVFNCNEWVPFTPLPKKNISESFRIEW